MSVAPSSRPSDEAMSPHCRLARHIEQYADEHDRCPGDQEIRRPDAPMYEVPVVTTRCVCDCHRG